MSALLARLRAVPGAGLREHAPVELEGAQLAATLRPESGEALAEALRLCGESGSGVLIRGGGSRLATANAPCTAQLLLDTTGLCAAPEVDSGEGVAHCAAGASLESLRAALCGSGWELPLDPPGANSTLGGALAAAAAGPCFAAPRHCVLGLSVALATGEHIRCGGRVVKNVSGYDLNKLFVGSFGSLGVLTAAWLRLSPAPQARAALRAALPPGEPAWCAALAAARRATVRAAAVCSAADSPQRALYIELAGAAEAVAADAEALAAGHGAAPLAESADELAAQLRARQAAGALRVRVACRATRLAAAAEILAAAGASLLAFPARGILYGSFAEAQPEPVWDAVQRAAAAGDGNWRVLCAPAAMRAGREVFGAGAAELRLARALKLQYDPAAVLNPGRFAGRL